MPKKETGKNTKGTKKTTTKSTVSKKTTTKPSTKKVEVKEVKKETVKPVVTEKIVERKVEQESIMNNTPFVIALCVIILLIAILIFVACSKRIPKTSNGNDIVVSLKDKDITANELYEELKETNGTNALLNLVDAYIADKEVTIKDADKQYAQEVVDYYKEYAEYYGVDLKTFISSYLGISGVSTESEFFDFVLEDYKKTLAVKNYIGNDAKEEDLKKHYEENFSDKLTVRHILIEIDAEAEDEEQANKEAYDKAVSLINELNETNQDDIASKFEDLAKNNSDDTATYSNGGLMEDMTKQGIQESFFNAANELKDGEYTKEPVKTTYGYHVILRVSSKPVEKFEDIKDEVKNSYAEKLLASDSSLRNIKWDELRSKYKMSIKDDIIKKAYEDALANEKKNEETEEN